MKQLFTLMITMLAVMPASAQKLRVSVDKISGDTTWATPMAKLFSRAGAGQAGELLEFSLSHSTGLATPVLTFYLRTGRHSLFSIPPGSKVFLKLKDGSVVEAGTPGAVSDRITATFGGGIKPSYALTDDEMRSLSESPVTFIRIEYTGGVFEYDIPVKNQEKFSRMITALYPNTPRTASLTASSESDLK